MTLYRRFPATLTVAAPYVVLIVPPALVYGNDGVWFLLGIALIAVFATLTVEGVASSRNQIRVPTCNVETYGRGLYYLALIAITLSAATGVLAAYGGKGSVAVQVGVAEGAGGVFVTLDSIISGWGVVGWALALAAYVGGQCRRREFYGATFLLLAGKAVSVYFTRITAPLLSLLVLMAILLLLFGLVKVRALLVAVALTLMLWPAVFSARNELRAAEGVWVSRENDAFDRLRFDVQFARVRELTLPIEVDVPGFLQHPTLLDVLRFGIVPRFLDPGRDLISTGQVINVALGGPVTSAYTFGPVTTAYALEGPYYLFFYYLLLAVLITKVWSRGMRVTPVRTVLLAVLINGPLGWFSTFPDAFIGMIQSLVSATPLLLGLFILRVSQGRTTKSALRGQVRPRGSGFRKG